MTKVAMIFEKEKEEAVNEERKKWQQVIKEEKQKGQQAVEEEKQKSQQAIREEKMKFALKMIADGELSLKKIAEYTELNIKIVTELAGQ